VHGPGAAATEVLEAGDLLISMLYPDAIAEVAPEAETVTWAMTGPWRRQHQPTLLDNGRLLLFDNRGQHRRSSVIELDPDTGRIVWKYEGTKKTPFYSYASGSCQRLANGNTLITESDNGRAFEVTPEKEIVWEFYNPHRAGEDDELIATLFELIRLPEDYLAAARNMPGE